MVRLPHPVTQSVTPSARLRRSTLQAVTLSTVICGAAAAEPPPPMMVSGDMIVVDSSAGTDDHGALFIVKKQSGKRRLLSDFGDPAQGDLGMTPTAVAFESMQSLIAVDVNGGTGLSGALYRIDPLTGQRSILSDFGDSKQGPLGVNPSGVAVERSGSLLVVDASAGSDHRGRLFRVDPRSGEREIVSDFSNVGQGALGVTPVSIALESTGQILVTDANLIPGAAGHLFRIDPVTGIRTVLSNFGDPGAGPLGVDPSSVAVDRSGRIVVVDPGSAFGAPGAQLFHIDPVSGERAVVSDFNNVDQGLTGLTPVGVALDANGRILVVDPDAGDTQNGGLLRVDREDGDGRLLSDFGNPDQGVTGSDPVGLAVRPGIPFKNFKFKIKFDAASGWLWVRGHFALDRQSDGINILRDFVRVQLGDTVHLLPPDACAVLSGRAVKCEASAGSTSAVLLVRMLGRNRFAFNIVARGLDLARMRKALPFALAIGNEMGAGVLRLERKFK